MFHREAVPIDIRAVLRVSGVAVLVDTIFYTVLSPLLTQFASDADLNGPGVGLLVACYPLGMAIGSVPAGMITSRRGPRGVLVAGALLTAITCLVFPLSSSAGFLMACRLVQGMAGALSWTAALTWVSVVAPPRRRGEMLGRLFGASVVGAMLGPVVGAGATIVGLVPTFAGIAAIATGLALAAGKLHRPPTAPSSGWVAALRLSKERTVTVGLWVTALGGAGIGVINATAPTKLEGLGVSAVQTGLVFMVMAGVGATASPWVGRLSDVKGRRAAVLLLLVLAVVAMVLVGWASTLMLFVPALVLAATALEALYVPGNALIVDGTAELEMAGGEILALTNLVWALGVAVASLLAGTATAVAGGPAPYTLLALVAVITVPLALRFVARPEVASV